MQDATHIPLCHSIRELAVNTPLLTDSDHVFGNPGRMPGIRRDHLLPAADP